MVRLSWSRALAWRMRQQLLDPVGTESVAGVVRRLGAVSAQLDAAAELAVRTRRERSRPGEVARALAEGRIIKTFAFRGATHLLTPEDGGAYLALRAASRMWELPSWQSFYGLTPSDWPLLREAVRDALADGPMTRGELGAAVTAQPKFRHLGFAFADGSGTLLKPFAWQGDLSFGPPRDGRATFQRLDVNPRWAGVPDLDEAGMRAVEAYFLAYGPATPDHVRYWLGNGRARAANESSPGSRVSATASRRSTSTGNPPTSCARISRNWPRRRPRLPYGSCRDTTNGSSVRAQPTPTSCRPPRGRWSAVGQIS